MINEQQYRAEQEQHRQEMLDYQIRQIPFLITSALIQFGTLWGKANPLASDDMIPGYDRLSYGFEFHYGRFRVFYCYQGNGDSRHFQRFHDVLLGRNECYGLNAIEVLQDKFAELMAFLAPRIKQINKITTCQCPYHQSNSQSSNLWLDCSKINEHWWCENCCNIANFNYDEPRQLTLPSGKNTAQSERAKMSNTIRFAVLERDSFSCKACGRNPRDHHINLHVDHIHPIAKGGKTIIENLQTLCQDCNLAKSDKIVQQMALW